MKKTTQLLLFLCLLLARESPAQQTVDLDHGDVRIRYSNITPTSMRTEEITLQTGETLHWALVKRYGVGFFGLNISPTSTSPISGFLRIYGTNTDLRVHELRANTEYPTSSDPWSIVIQVGSLITTGRITVKGLAWSQARAWPPYNYHLYVQKSKGELYSTIQQVTFSTASSAAGKVAALEAWKRGLSIPAAYDDTELHSKITALETRVGNLSSGGVSYDDTELRSKIKALEKRDINTIIFAKKNLTQLPDDAMGLTKRSVVIVPNPVRQALGLTVYQDYDYAIYDSSGTSVKSGKTSEGRINASELQAVTYVL